MPSEATPLAAIRSPVAAALAVDFADAPVEPRRKRIVLTSEGGRIDGVAHWLRLDFGDGIVYENAPSTGPSGHWISPIHVFAAPRNTAPGGRIAVDASVFGKRLVVSAAAD